MTKSPIIFYLPGSFFSYHFHNHCDFCSHMSPVYLVYLPPHILTSKNGRNTLFEIQHSNSAISKHTQKKNITIEKHVLKREFRRIGTSYQKMMASEMCKIQYKNVRRNSWGKIQRFEWYDDHTLI